MAVENCTTAQAREDRAIYRALRILESRMKTGGDAMTGTDAVRDYLRLRLAGEEREVFAVVFLNARHRVIETEILFQGTLNQTQVYPREIARRALLHNAAAILLAHNHPSGLADPSRADLALTRALIDTLALVDVRVLDHFIIGSEGAVSLQEIGLFGELDFPAELPGDPPTPKPKRNRRAKESAREKRGNLTKSKHKAG